MWRAGPLRTARHKRRARIAYSVTCADLRITTRMIQIVFGAIPGFNQSKNGVMNRDVCSADIRSVEPRNITPSQTNNGSQYLKKDFIQRSNVTGQRSAQKTPNIQHRTLNVQWRRKNLPYQALN